jgi:hypothetical protein
MANVDNLENAKNQAETHGGHAVDGAQHQALDQIAAELLKYHLVEPSKISFFLLYSDRIGKSPPQVTDHLVRGDFHQVFTCLNTPKSKPLVVSLYLGTAILPLAFWAKVGMGKASLPV